MEYTVRLRGISYALECAVTLFFFLFIITFHDSMLAENCGPTE